MYMDLTDMISGGTEEQQIPEQKLTKEEYAAKKQQEQEQLPETVTALKAAQSDTDEMVVDQEYRITMLELGVSDTDDTDNADNT